MAAASLVNRPPESACAYNVHNDTRSAGVKRSLFARDRHTFDPDRLGTPLYTPVAVDTGYPWRFGELRWTTFDTNEQVKTACEIVPR